MQSFTNNNLKVYSLTGESFLPEWMSTRERRKMLRQNPKLQKRIDLIQGLGMPDICTSATVTADSKYLLALGTYKPRLRCYEFAQNSLKFERGLDFEALKVIATSTDYTRLVILQTDRFVEFHTGCGRHYRTRVPDESRDFCLNEQNADLFFIGKSSSIHRLNIYQGQFMEPFKSPDSELRCCEINNDLQLLGVGTEMGNLELWDSRDKNVIAQFNPALSNHAVTKLRFGPKMKLAVGNENGLVLLFDLRSRKPYSYRDHHYGLPINQLEFLNHQGYIASSDMRGIRVWTDDARSRLVVSFEPPKVAVNGFCQAEAGTGLFFVPTESPTIHTFFVPSLGPAPRFCSFLDNLVEQMQEKEDSHQANEFDAYDNFKFLTRKEMDDLCISSFIGTPMSRPYMHGFLVQTDAYQHAVRKQKAKSSDSNTLEVKGNNDKVIAYNEEDQSNQTQLAKSQDDSMLEQLPSVNKDLFVRLSGHLKRDSSSLSKAAGKTIVNDSRFAALFQDEDYNVSSDDENAHTIGKKTSVIHKTTTSTMDITNSLPDDDDDDGDEANDGLSDLRSSSSSSSSFNQSSSFERVNYDDRTFNSQQKLASNVVMGVPKKQFRLVASKLTDFAQDRLSNSNQHGEKSMTFIPTQKNSSKVKCDKKENRKEYIKRRKESNLRPVNHIIRSIEKSNNKRTFSRVR